MVILSSLSFIFLSLKKREMLHSFGLFEIALQEEKNWHNETVWGVVNGSFENSGSRKILVKFHGPGSFAF